LGARPAPASEGRLGGEGGRRIRSRADKEETMPYNTLIMEKEGEIVTVILNRPEKLNAMTHELLAELGMAMDEVNAMSDVRVVIIKGQGRAFSSGTDLQSLAGGEMDRTRPGFRYHITRMQGTFNSIERLEKPVIAQIHGYALGAAMELVLACDFRICSLDCRFSLPEVRYGILPDLGGCQRLLRVVGLAKAKELVMLARTIDGAEAQRIGLVHKAVEAEGLEAEVRRWAEEILGLPPLSVGLGKRVLDKSADMDLMSAQDLTTQVQSMLMRTGDFLEGVRSKMEGRRPSFKGE
jgi:enoyl-CoA hydratase/carnithine racemase